MVDNNQLRNRAYSDSYNGPQDYSSPEGNYGHVGDRVYSRRYYDPNVDESMHSSRDISVDDSQNPAVRSDLDRSLTNRPLRSDAGVDVRQPVRGDRNSGMYVSDSRVVDSYQSDIQEVHRSNNIAIGLLLGVLLTSIIGILAAIFYFSTTEPQPTVPTTPDTTETAPNETQEAPDQP